MYQEQIEQLKQQLNNQADSVLFEDVMKIVDTYFDFTPTAFTNGQQSNGAGENSGSCKLFSLAQLENFNSQQTLQCFGQYYRDVMATPDGEDHQNIRQFMTHGWDGIKFEQTALIRKVD